MNRLSVLGQKVEKNLQIKMEFESEFQNYKLHLLSPSIRDNQTFT